MNVKEKNATPVLPFEAKFMFSYAQAENLTTLIFVSATWEAEQKSILICCEKCEKLQLFFFKSNQRPTKVVRYPGELKQKNHLLCIYSIATVALDSHPCSLSEYPSL